MRPPRACEFVMAASAHRDLNNFLESSPVNVYTPWNAIAGWETRMIDPVANSFKSSEIIIQTYMYLDFDKCAWLWLPRTMLEVHFGSVYAACSSDTP